MKPEGDPAGATAEDTGLAGYLGAHAPFQSMSPAALAGLAARATVRTFATGDLIVDYVTAAPDEIWMVRSGQAVLLADRDAGRDPLDAVGPGGIFGYGPMLSAGKVAFIARAAERSELIRLPGPPVRAVFDDAAGLSYLATRAWDTIVTRSPRDRTSLVAVQALIPRAPVFAEPETSIRDAVRTMAEERSSYVLIRAADGLGIFTDRDLRARVIAADVPLDTPLRTVMSVPARTVPADRIAATVLMDMLESGIEHVPVVDRHGRILGVVEDRDLVATSTRQSFMVRRAIALATDATGLRAATERMTTLAVNLFRGGTDAVATSAVLSVMIDAVVRRALDLEQGRHAADPDRVAWDGRFAWLTLGSIARREAMPSSDVDSAISWADDWAGGAGLDGAGLDGAGLDGAGLDGAGLDGAGFDGAGFDGARAGGEADGGARPDVAALRAMAVGVHAVLDECGLPADSNGALAYTPRFCRSATQWAAAAAGWLDDPMRDRGIIMSSLLLDAQVVRGNPALNTAPAAFRRMPVDHPNALRLQLLDALSGKPRVRSVLDVVGRRGGTFDLKSHALTPIVNLARWAGLAAGLGPGSTVDRLSAGAEAGALTPGDAVILREVFELVQRLRMSHQIEQVAAGVGPGDIVTLSELSPLSRSLLNDGMREVVAVQRRVRGAATLRAVTGAPAATVPD